MDLNLKIKEVTVAKEQYEKTLKSLAKDVQDKVVKPFCSKYNLEFIAGLANFWFYIRDKNKDRLYLDVEELSKYLKSIDSSFNEKEFNSMIELFSIETQYDCMFTQYMEDIYLRWG